jgi:hypothetical protein
VGNATTGAGQVAAAIVNDVFTNVTSGSLTVVYNVRPFAGGCFGDAINVTLTVSPEPVMNASLNATVCSDAVSGITLNTSGTSAAASSYDIISITPQVGLVAAVGNATTGVGQAASAIVNDVFTNPTAVPLTVVYNVRALTGSCYGSALNITLTISPEPVMSGSLSGTVCSDAVSGITLATNGTSIGAGSYTINSITIAPGLLASGTNATIGAGQAAAAIVNDVFTNPTAGALTVVYNVTPVTATCAGNAVNITLTVNPEPVMSASLNATVCSAAVSGITFNTNGTSVGAASYEIISITPQVGLTAAVGNATTGAGQVAAAIVNDVFTNVTSGSLTVVYNVRPFAGGCFGDAINVTLTVSPEPVMNASLNATVCSDAVSGITLNTSGTSASASSYDIISITPQVGLVAAVGNATTGVGQAASAIVNDVFTNPTAVPLTVVYNVRALTGSCYGSALNITLTVSPEPVMSGSLSGTVCSDAVSGITLATNGTSIGAGSYTINSITIAPGLLASGTNATIGAGQAAGAIVNDVFTNPTAGALTVVYNVTPGDGHLRRQCGEHHPDGKSGACDECFPKRHSV